MTKKNKARLLLAGLIFCAVLASLALAWARAARPEELSVFAMGSYVQQTVWGGRDSARKASEAVTQLENRISWRREGEIAQINQQAGQAAVPISGETAALLDEILKLCEKSNGAIDVTLGPVTRLWDFDSNPHLPDRKELEEALGRVDYRNLQTGEEAFWTFAPVDKALYDGEVPENAAALTKAGMSVDLGAVGKGAACDTAIASYRETGVSRAVVAVGGSVGLYGQKPFGEPWKVAVRDPGGMGSMGTLELEGGFVSTSGSYEKFFEEEGKTYCHLLDPRTGYPAESGLVSVTIWHPESGLLSDGLATACFVLGLEKSLPLLESYGAEAVFVDEAGNFFISPGMAGRFALTAGSGYTQGDWPGEAAHE